MINIRVIEDDDRVYDIRYMCYDRFRKIEGYDIYPDNQAICTVGEPYKYGDCSCFNIGIVNPALDIETDLARAIELLGVIPESDDALNVFPEEIQNYCINNCAIRLLIPEYSGSDGKVVTVHDIVNDLETNNVKCNIFPFEHEYKPNLWVVAALGYSEHYNINPNDYKPVTIRICKYDGQLV